MTGLSVVFERPPLVERIEIDGVCVAGPSEVSAELRIPLLGALHLGADALDSTVAREQATDGALERAIDVRLRLPAGLRTRAQRVDVRSERSRVTITATVSLSIVRWIPAATLVVGMRADPDTRFDGVPFSARSARQEHVACAYAIERSGRRLVASIDDDAWVRARARTFACPDGSHGFVLRTAGRLPRRIGVALTLATEAP